MPRMILDDAYAPSLPRARRNGKLALGIVACVLTIGIGLVSLRYAIPSHPGAAPLPNAKLNPVALSLHAVPAALALLIMPFQLNGGFLRRHLRLHRAIGRSYAGLVFVAGLAAIWIAPAALGGPVSTGGFTTLGLAWITATALGVAAAIRGDIAVHRMWMTRSAALTFSAVMLRVLLPIATKILGIDFVAAYRAISWLCWLPNLVVAELWLRRAGSLAKPVPGAAQPRAASK